MRYCPNLIGKELAYDYKQTKVAYNNFIKNVGFEFAADKVIKQITEVRAKYKNVFIVGYSVGATVAWLCSDKVNLCDGIIGYYGSRIRDYTEITPKCPTLLFMPSEERTLNYIKKPSTAQ